MYINNYNLKRAIIIPTCSNPYDNTFYEISIGDELLGFSIHTVIKVWLVRGGKAVLDQPLSVEYNSDDTERIYNTIKTLKQKYSENPDECVMETMP